MPPVSSSLDLDTAKTNLAAEIEETRSYLANLEARQKSMNEAGPDVLLLIETLSKYGRVRKPVIADTTDSPTLDTLPADASDRDRVLAAVTHADAPVRAEALVTQLGLTRQDVSGHLTKLHSQKRIKRMSHGLYWRATPRKGAAIVEALAEHTNGAQPNIKENAALLREHVTAVLKASHVPLGVVAITEAVIARGFTYSGKNPKAATARVLAELGKKIKRTGWAKGAKSEWRR